MSAAEQFMEDDAPAGSIPHNIDVEQGLLGAILMNNEVLDQISPFLAPDDFYDGLHGRIYENCLTLRNDGRRADPLTLKDYFRGETINDLEVWQYLGKLVGAAAIPMSCLDYGRTIKDLAGRRTLVGLSAWLSETVSQPGFKVADTVGSMIGELDTFLASSQDGKRTVDTLCNTSVQAVKSLDSDKVPSTPTGLADLDRVMGGYFPGEFVILAARPGMGKSCFAPSTLLQTARKGNGVMYFSLEMTGEALAQRCLSDLIWNSSTPVPYIDIRRRLVSDHDKERFRKAAESLKNITFVIDDRPGLTVAEVAARARAQAERFARDGKRLSVIAIDHLGKMRASGRYAGNKVQETGEISAGLAELAKDLNCTVLALSQLSRQVEGRDNKRPVLADLRNSGDLEQDADAVIFLYRRAYYLESIKSDDHEKEASRLEKLEDCKNEMDIIVAKQRSGPCRTMTAFCDMASNVVRGKHG